MKLPGSGTPAPALSRGLRLIGILSTEGQAKLEQLAQHGGWPKSSTLRYLQALEAEGVVRQDPATRTWHLLKVLRALPDGEEDALAPVTRQLAGIADRCGHCAELYRVSKGTIELIDRADPEQSEVRVAARIGFIRGQEELDATVQVACVYGESIRPKARLWVWSAGEKKALPVKKLEALLEATRKNGYGMDNDFNENGIRRFAVPVVQDENLIGIVAVAQRQTPRAEAEVPVILRTLIGGQKEK